MVIFQSKSATAGERLTSSANTVDLWQIDLAATDDGIQHYRPFLSLDEVQRADRFYFERDRGRFIVARGAMRQILSCYLCLAPQDLRFSYGLKGKPELSGDPKQSGIKFNLSHSSDRALLAVADGLTVGVDLEWVNAGFATEEIAERFFSAKEVQTLRASPSAQRAEAFFSCWTRKEAYIKAMGNGLSIPLDSFAVAFVPGIPAALLHVEANPAEVDRWSMYNIEVGRDYKAALVAEGKGHRLQQIQWDSLGFSPGGSNESEQSKKLHLAGESR
jgi:4'-phosphopantetheinyl transferase